MSVNRRTFLALTSAAVAAQALALDDEPGRIELLQGIGFEGYPQSRVRLWLPPDYDASGASYRTLYMLDGQYAFASDSDGQNFAVDRRMAQLAAEGAI